jgi:hypothetical protein
MIGPVQGNCCPGLYCDTGGIIPDPKTLNSFFGTCKVIEL